MKTIIYYTALLLGFVSHSQSPALFEMYIDNVIPHSFSTDFTSKNIYKNTNSPAIYNPMIPLNNKYANMNGNHYMSNVTPDSFSLGISSKDIHRNTNLFTVYNSATQTKEYYTEVDGNYQTGNIKPSLFYSGGIRTDSLNPHGATTLGGALFSGIFGGHCGCSSQR